MKKFLKKIALFLFLYLLVSWTVKYVTPYWLHNHWLAPKFHYISENKLQPNTVFIGSSRIYRHIIPTLFDSLTKETNSFNLGAPSVFCPQTYYLLENIINDKNFDSLKYCFIELTGVDSISGHLLHQPQANYWLTPEYFAFSLAAIKDKPYLPLKGKVFFSKNYLFSFLDNSLNLGHFKDVFIKQKAYFHLSNPQNKGFSSLDDVLKNATSKEVIEKFKARKSAIENPALLAKRAAAIQSMHELKTVKINQVHYEKNNRID